MLSVKYHWIIIYALCENYSSQVGLVVEKFFGCFLCHGLNFWSCWYLGKVRCTSTITALAHVQRVYRLFARTRHGLFSTRKNVENDVLSVLAASKGQELVYLYTVPYICMDRSC